MRAVHLRTVVAAFGLLVIVALACDDDPFAIDWDVNPDTVTLYSMARPELNLPSAFDFLSRRVVRIESAAESGGWDIAVDTEDEELVLLPPRVLGVISEARIAPMPGASFFDLREAPSDTTLYISDRSLPARVGEVFVVRTHEQSDFFFGSCNYFAKMEVLGADVERQTLTFQFDVNPECDSRRLIPRGD
jgi:hypothetical protein